MAKGPNKYNKATERIGLRKINIDGEWMEITEYHNTHDITIQFEDGTIVYHKEYKRFLKGEIENPDYHVKTSMTLYEFLLQLPFSHHV